MPSAEAKEPLGGPVVRTEATTLFDASRPHEFPDIPQHDLPRDAMPAAEAKEPLASPAIRTNPSMLFDYSRLHEFPDVPQFDLERYDPPHGVPVRIRSIESPETIARLNNDAALGRELGAEGFYNLNQVLQYFIGEHGEERGKKAFNRFIDFFAATGPRTDAIRNIRNASYYFNLVQQGQPLPRVVWDGNRSVVIDKIPRLYWHPSQPIYMRKINEILEHGRLLPLQGPKIASISENGRGNYMPIGFDVHFTREAGLVDASGRPARAPARGEYGYAEKSVQRIAAKFGLPPALFKAAVRFGAAHLTGLRSPLEPLIKILEMRISATA